MRKRQPCVFCGSGPDGIFPLQELFCAGVPQPTCKRCLQRLERVSEEKRCALALASGRAAEPETLRRYLERMDEGGSGLTCLRCGGELWRYQAGPGSDEETWLQFAPPGSGPMAHCMVSGKVKVELQYCRQCGHMEFFHRGYLEQKAVDDSLGDGADANT